MKLKQYSASWCASCKTVTALIQQVDLPEDITYEYIDIDRLDRMQLSALNIRGIPTVILTDDENNELRRVTGVMTQAQLNNMLGD